jgi:hypothetical protein
MASIKLGLPTAVSLQEAEGDAKTSIYSLPSKDPHHAESHQSGGRYVKFSRGPSWKLKRERLQQWLRVAGGRKRYVANMYPIERMSNITEVRHCSRPGTDSSSEKAPKKQKRRCVPHLCPISLVVFIKDMSSQTRLAFPAGPDNTGYFNKFRVGPVEVQLSELVELEGGRIPRFYRKKKRSAPSTRMVTIKADRDPMSFSSVIPLIHRQLDGRWWDRR